MPCPRPEKSLFTQFHAQYPLQEKERIIDGLTLGKSKLSIVFARVAFGVGLDLKDIRQIIHIDLPCTMEEYFQEASRARRDGLPCKTHIYNSYDTSKARKNSSSVMRDYVQSKKCKREIIMSILGFLLCHLTQLKHVAIIMRNFVAVLTVCSLVLHL